MGTEIFEVMDTWQGIVNRLVAVEKHVEASNETD
jgi:hypothetical protein